MGYSLPPTHPQAEPDPNNPWQAKPPPASPRQRRIARRLLIFVAAPLAAVLLFAVLVSLLATPSPAPIVVAPPAATAAPPVMAVPTLPPPDVPARPANVFAAGIYDVGTASGQMPPGKYRTDGPGQGVTGYCYYARLSATDGEIESILASINTTGPAVVTVKPTDAAFEIQGDCKFMRAS